MQLRHDVAELAVVQLEHRPPKRRTDGPHGLPGHSDFSPQPGLIMNCKIGEFDEIAAPRRQHDPGEPRIVLQPDLAKLQLSQEVGASPDAGVQDERHDRLWRPESVVVKSLADGRPAKNVYRFHYRP